MDAGAHAKKTTDANSLALAQREAAEEMLESVVLKAGSHGAVLNANGDETPDES